MKKFLKNILLIFVIICALMFKKDILSFSFDMISQSVFNYMFNKSKSDQYNGLDITLTTLKIGESFAEYNTKELQSAINMVSESGGGTVYLPSGTYYFGPGGHNLADNEDFAIKCRNNVHLKGKGTDENSLDYTVLKPYYNNPSGNGSMDMFYFNNYKDSGFNSVNYDISSLVNVSYVNSSGQIVNWENQTVYLINADFSDFVIDGDSVRGGIATAGGQYLTDGKGFMINLFSNCDWNNVVVKNTDATGFGVDCPINSTIRNCKAINCGKAATTSDNGASGFGIGIGYSEKESLVIEDSVAINNKKFGFFFEHQAKFSDKPKYMATTSNGYVVSNSIAGGNMYDFGGLKSFDVTYQNNRSISNLDSYKVDGLNPNNTEEGIYKYTTLSFSDDKVNLNDVVQPIYFSQYSSNSFSINTNIYDMLTDVDIYHDAVKWGVNSGVFSVKSATEFGSYDLVNRMEVIKTLYRFTGREIPISNTGTINERQQYKNAIRNIGYTDLEDEKYIDELDSVLWAFNNKMISQSETFNPEDLCNRASLVAMLYRWEGNPEVTGEHPFVDVPAGTWYSDPVLWAYQNGIITGVENDTFSPTGSVNKLQLVLILYRYNEIYSKDFKLNINLIGGSADNVSSYNRDSSFTLTNPVKSGYTFIGWTGSNGDIPSKNVVIEKGTVGNLSYTANWEPNLVDLFIKEKAKIIEYNLGDKLNTDGLIVSAKYADDNIKDIENYSISPLVLNELGEQVITISYDNFETSYNVIVKEKQITEISIYKKPSKLNYYIGEKLNTEGLELKVSYDDGSSSIIKSGFTTSLVDLTKEGVNKIIVKFNEKSVSYDVNVKKVNVTGIDIYQLPKKTNYHVGEKFNSDGLKIFLIKDNGSKEIISTGFKLSIDKDYIFNDKGSFTIKVNYDEFNTSFEVNVQEIVKKTLTLVKFPDKTNYLVGEKFSTEGILLELISSNGERISVYEYESSIDNESILNEQGTKNIIITFNDYSTNFEINVRKLISLDVINNSSKTEYNIGDTFDFNNIEVTAKYEDGFIERLYDQYKIDVEGGNKFSTLGEKNVTVSYGEISTTFIVNVVDDVVDNEESNIKIYIIISFLILLFIILLIYLFLKNKKKNDIQVS